jgi:hypothetical protein
LVEHFTRLGSVDEVNLGKTRLSYAGFFEQVQAALAIHGFAICGFDYSHPILVEPNPLLI